MNSKKGLSRIMSALLAASSMIGGANASRVKNPAVNKASNSIRKKGREKKAKNEDEKKKNEKGKVKNKVSVDRKGKKIGDKGATLPTEPGVVNWIKSHPKTSVGVGIGIGAIGSYVCYKVCDSELNKMCRKMFNEENFGNFYALDWCEPEVFDCPECYYCRFGQLVDVGDERKCRVNFSIRRECFYDGYKNFNVGEDLFLDFCLRVVIFAYFCERMVKIHPEWKHLLVDKSRECKEIDVVAGVKGDLIGWFDAEKDGSEHGQDSSDLLKAKVWAGFLSKFYKKYFNKLKARLKNYGEVNKLSIKDKLTQKERGVPPQKYKRGKELW